MCVGPKTVWIFRGKNAFVSDKNLNKIYITWRLNTAQVHKTRNHNLSHILKAHHTVKYVTTNFVFLLPCVSSADVDLWVNGGWDQPNCGVTLNPGFLLLFLQNLDFRGKICNFLFICGFKIVFKILKQF